MVVGIVATRGELGSIGGERDKFVQGLFLVGDASGCVEGGGVS